MFIAVYFLITGVFGLQLLGYQGWVTDAFYGVVLVAAVAASAWVQRRVRG
jgi:ribose transport system permease protein